MKVRKVFKIGNSLAASLPKEIVEELEIQEGDYLRMESKNSQIIIEKVFKPE